VDSVAAAPHIRRFRIGARTHQKKIHRNRHAADSPAIETA
jgi:hypothetical protein